MIKRSEHNPIIKPQDITPTRKDMRVVGAFNAGMTLFNEEVVLLIRVSEEMINETQSRVRIPVLDGLGQVSVVNLETNKASDNYDFSDPRSVLFAGTKKRGKVKYLTSLSHFRIARSKDGVHFTIDKKPTLLPEGPLEKWGIEDPRISKINDTYHITYSAVSPYGVGTSLMTTKDFEVFTRQGMIFPPENKDVCLFPEKINGKYKAYHRPVPSIIGSPDIWIAESKDLQHWGQHQHVLSSETVGENVRIGGGAPPLKTDKGWLNIFHGADQEKTYSLWAFIADLNNPDVIIARTKNPILIPSEPYETEGYFPNVVFPCGAFIKDKTLILYYGVSDESMARAEIKLSFLYEAMKWIKVE